MRPLARRQQRLVEEELFEAEPLAGRLDFLARSRGSGRRVIASPTPASPRRARSSAGSGSITLRRQPTRLLDPVAGSAAAFSCSVAGMDRDAARRSSGGLALARRQSRAPYSRDPRSRVCRGSRSAAAGRPGPASAATQGWLNQVARTMPDVVADFDRGDREAAAAERARGVAEDLDLDGRLSRPARARRPGRRCGRGGCGGSAGGGRRRSRCRPRAAASASFGPDPVERPQRDLEDARAGPVDRGVAQLRRGQLARRRRRRARATGRRAATTSSAARPRGSRSRPRRGRGRRSPRAGSAPPRRRSR